MCIVKWKLFSCAWLFATPWSIQSKLSRPEHWSGLPIPSSGNLSNPEIKPRSPALHVVSLPAEPPGKPKNTGVGSLSLLQGIFLTQESSRGLLHCRRTLYQLSYQGSQRMCIVLNIWFLYLTIGQHQIWGNFSQYSSNSFWRFSPLWGLVLLWISLKSAEIACSLTESGLLTYCSKGYCTAETLTGHLTKEKFL